MESIESRILDFLQTNKLNRLPSAPALGSLLNVSTCSIRKALCNLRENGKLTFSRGSSIRTACLQPEITVPLRPPDAASKLADEIRGQIRKGMFKQGDVLPCARKLIANFLVSTRTVAQAYEILRRENRAERIGRLWKVPFKRKPPHPNQVVLLVQQSEYVWRDLSAINRTADFCQRFLTDALDSRLEVVPALAIADTGTGYARHVHAGKKSIHELLQKLDQRYAGALIVGQSWTYWQQDSNTEGMTPWFRWFVRYNKPVVWWDTLDEVGGANSAPFMENYRKQLKDKGFRSLFRRLFLDETRAARIVIETCLEMRHTRVAFVSGPYCQQAWCIRRLALLQESNRLIAHDTIDIEVSPPTKFRGGDDALIGGMAVRGPLAGESAFHGTYDERFNDSERIFCAEMDLARRSFMFINRRETTCIICANDDIARLAGYWARENLLSIPGRISIISFDADLSRQYPFNSSSVDFNSGLLGSEAIRTFLQFKGTESYGDFGSSCGINHYGSITQISKDQHA